MKFIKLRETRNDVAGHPTCRDNYSTYLSREAWCSALSLRKIQYQETKNDEFLDFDILTEGICTQEKFIKEQLEEILSMLRDETKEHIEKFKNDKLEDCFEDFIYASGKIYHEGFYTQNDQNKKTERKIK